MFGTENTALLLWSARPAWPLCGFPISTLSPLLPSHWPRPGARESLASFVKSLLPAPASWPYSFIKCLPLLLGTLSPALRFPGAGLDLPPLLCFCSSLQTGCARLHGRDSVIIVLTRVAGCLLQGSGGGHIQSPQELSFRRCTIPSDVLVLESGESFPKEWRKVTTMKPLVHARSWIGLL